MDATWEKMYEAAKAVRRARRVSDYIEAGEVSAAVLSRSGKIFTGVCVDTCSGLGLCAERSAIFAMMTAGEDAFDRVLCIMPDGRCGAPCGACRELMIQLMPREYPSVEIMLDFEADRVVRLGELAPEWWIVPGKLS
ncbi:MAG: cytidine deaminase [Oscillospiraceae bacterium]|nr:cytidine deaminase [Oscillospiraceae bacterium]